MDLMSKDDTKTHKKSREESLVWTYGLQHTLNRVESNSLLSVGTRIKCIIIDLKKRRLLRAHTHKRNATFLLLRFF